MLIPHFYYESLTISQDIRSQISRWGSHNSTLLFPRKTENTVTWLTITWYWELLIDKNENIVQTRGRHTSESGKKGYDTSVIGRQEREKSAKYDIFHKLLKSVFLKSLAVSHKLQINNNYLM